MRPARRAVAWAAFLGWAALVWFVSSRSDPAGDLAFPWEIPDKVLHAAEFAVGGFLAREACLGSRSPFLAGLVLCAFWGFVDEVHQGYVPGRETDPGDLAADVTGAALGALFHRIARERAAGSVEGSR
jgi:VanZ family protein